MRLDAYDYDHISASVAATVARARFKPTQVVGHSLGSLIALHVVTHHRNQFHGSKIVLMNPPLWFLPEQGLEATAQHSFMFGLMTRHPEITSKCIIPMLSSVSRCTKSVWRRCVRNEDTLWYLNNISNYGHTGFAETMYKCVLINTIQKANEWSKLCETKPLIVMGRQDPICIVDDVLERLETTFDWLWTNGNHGSKSHKNLHRILLDHQSRSNQ